MERKKKGILILLIALLCFVAVGCGDNNSSSDDNDSKESSSEKKKNKEKDTEKETEKESEKKASTKSLTCTMDEDGGTITVVFTQDQKTYDFTSGSMKMKMDLGEAAESASASEYESILCDSLAEDIPFKTCKAKISGTDLVLDYDIDVDKFINEEFKNYAEEKDENTLSELKSELEKEDYSCKIS